MENTRHRESLSSRGAGGGRMRAIFPNGTSASSCRRTRLERKLPNPGITEALAPFMFTSAELRVCVPGKVLSDTIHLYSFI